MIQGRALVSIIIPTYNYGRFLGGAIESALNQTHREREVIVVDDGSTDETGSVVSQYAHEIVYIRQANLGTCAAKNAGLLAAKGAFVSFLDSDDRFLPNKVSHQLSVMERRPDVGWVYGDCEVVDMESGSTELISQRYRYHTKPMLEGDLFPVLLQGNFLATCTLLIRRPLFDKVGVFDAALRGGYEDWDMWLRIALSARAGYLPEPVAVVQRHRDSLSHDAESMLHAKFRVLEKLSTMFPEPVRETGWMGRSLIADMHNWYGYRLYREKRWREARVRLAASLRWKPLQRRALFCWFLCGLHTLWPPPRQRGMA